MGLMSRTQNPSSSVPPTGRDTNETEDHEHYKRVGQAAKEAYEYLEKTFAEKNNKLKAITAQGSKLNNMNFTNESVKTKVSSKLALLKLIFKSLFLLTENHKR
jgi:hypothetical protein